MGYYPSYALPSSNHILVVDDSPENLFLIESILQEEGHKIDVASDGTTALQMVQQSPPDLVLLDVMMPNMDGFEVTEQIRQNPNLPYIPILLITAYDQASVVKGLDVGADDFLRKPLDIDELLARVRSLLRLKHNIDQREQMERMREDFVSRLTHDLRTPLIAADRMLNQIQAEDYGQINPELKEAIAIMGRSNQNLLHLVNQLLEVYRYEAQRKVLNFAPVSFLEIIKEVMGELSPLVQEKELSLTLLTDDSPHYQMRGDRLELHRLVTNLISNAIKFTDKGEISLSLENIKDKIVFKVQDTGVGISPDLQKVLFNRFQSGHHRAAGSGLGLHLSRQIVETHCGSINVVSELGKGSIFTVCFPVF